MDSGMITNPVTKRRKVVKGDNVHDDEMAVQHPPRDQCVYVVSLAQYWSALEDADPKVEVDCLGFYHHEGAAVRALVKELIRRESRKNGSLIDYKKFVTHTNPDLLKTLSEDIGNDWDPVRDLVEQTGEEVMMSDYISHLKPILADRSSTVAAGLIHSRIAEKFLLQEKLEGYSGFAAPYVKSLPLQSYGIKLKTSSYTVMLGSQDIFDGLATACIGIFTEEIDAVRAFLHELVSNRCDDVDYDKVFEDYDYVSDCEHEWETYHFKEQLMDKMLEVYYSLTPVVAGMSKQEAIDKFVSTVYERYCYQDHDWFMIPARLPFEWNMGIFYRRINESWDDADGAILL
jgi:hypothetical protein